MELNGTRNQIVFSVSAFETARFMALFVFNDFVFCFCYLFLFFSVDILFLFSAYLKSKEN
jgi:hypothetical protein